MSATPASRQYLVSLPPAMAPGFAALTGRRPPEWFAAHDPAGQPLGSGGGTAHLLLAAWRATGQGTGFRAWLRSSQKLLIHGGGQSRRLPAYAPTGKLLTPMPVYRWSLGQRLDQTLLDLQLPYYRRVLDRAPAGIVAMVASGDVLIRFARDLPPLPEADVICLGLWVKPEEAQHFGVFFCPRRRPEQLAFFLQKPEPRRIEALAADHFFLVDTGIWLFSERALAVLLGKCGCARPNARSHARPYELYAEFGLGLGARPCRRDPAVSPLRVAVVPLPEGEFLHFGTSRDLVRSTSRLQNVVVDQRQLGGAPAKPHPDLFTQNTRLECPLPSGTHTLWLENSHLAAGWSLTREHVITGVPPNNWRLQLAPGTCLDVVPVGTDAVCLRGYGIDDRFSGPLGAPDTAWFGQPAAAWFDARGIAPRAAGLDPDADLQSAALFPVLAPDQLDGAFVQWLLAARPETNPACARRWCDTRRLSARDLAAEANIARLFAARTTARNSILPRLAANHARSVFFRLDLQHTAGLFAAADQPLPPPLSPGPDVMRHVHDRMFRAAVRRQRGERNWEREEAAAFALLRDAMVRRLEARPARPACTLLPDQIAWGRAPVRLDIAGGWTDTPPYCLTHGGAVVNLAVDLNGQPPIQVFVRRQERCEIILRSIDLGVEECLGTFADIADHARVGGAFSVPKAALALAGFHPRFQGRRPWPTLERQLRAFGGGLDLSLLAAVPKGSGLGTSSILAATVLGALADVCGLGWDTQELVQRTLALEQLLTTGGGWQDQAGGLLRSAKLLESRPGLDQTLQVKWLPEALFPRGAGHANHPILLYYTGLTRVARDILREIVRGMFLNAHAHLELLGELGQHALATYDVIQRADWDGFCAAVSRSWELNQCLDPGTNPPAVQAILAQVADWTAAAKLLGAGGGGYLLLLAKDDGAAERIRRSLSRRPPNGRARFVDFSLSPTGLQVTRS